LALFPLARHTRTLPAVQVHRVFVSSGLRPLIDDRLLLIDRADHSSRISSAVVFDVSFVNSFNSGF